MPASSKLFHAVVLMGYALAGCRVDASKPGVSGGSDGGARDRDRDGAAPGAGGRQAQARADAGRALHGRDGGAGTDTGVLTPIKQRLHDADAESDAGSLAFERDASAHDAGLRDAASHDAAIHTAADGGDAGWPSTK